MWTIQSENVAVTQALGRALGRVAQPGLTVALVGDLGAGKTALAQGVGIGLGLNQPVISPTFILVAEYDAPVPLLHADLYRIEPAELPALGLEEMLETWPGLALVEWADRGPGVLPLDHLRVRLTQAAGPEGPPGRLIRVKSTGQLSRAALHAWREEAGRAD